MDRATTHYEENLVQRFQKYNFEFILIPPGLTRYVQQLDMCVNAPFKKNYNIGILIFAIDNKNEKKPKEDDICYVKFVSPPPRIQNLRKRGYVNYVSGDT